MTEQKLKTQQDKKYEGKVVRILSKDIDGNMPIYAGLTKIKGISWAFSNLICKKLNIEKTMKIGSLTPEKIKKIIEFVKNPDGPKFILNRRHDFETGKDKHLTETDLELQKEFDIKRLRKIKSYKGIRHSAGLPVRGQRTRSNFRKNRGKSVGIKKKKKQ